MFKDTKQGQTHYDNDGCGEKEHNKDQIEERVEKLISNFYANLSDLDKSDLLAFVEKEKQLVKEEMIEKLKENIIEIEKEKQLTRNEIIENLKINIINIEISASMEF